MFKKTLLVLILLLCSVNAVHGQDFSLKMVRIDSTIMKLNQMSVADFSNLVIPPLEEMYNNARLYSNAAKYFQYEAEYARREVVTAKKKPLEWIKLVASYNFGNMDMAAISLMETSYAVWTQNRSSQTNMYYSVGVTLSIPLLDIFNTRNKVKQNEAKYIENQYRFESELDEIKKEIIDLYCLIYEKIAVLKTVSEAMVSATAQYHMAEMDFANNKIDAETLYNRKSYEEVERKNYEKEKKELISALLSLEIVSCTPIVSDLK